MLIRKPAVGGAWAVCLAALMPPVPAHADSLFTYVDQDGHRSTYTAANRNFRLAQSGQQLHVLITEPGNDYRGSRTTFAAPLGAPLAVGHYSNAQCPGFNYGRAPAMQVENLADAGCIDDTGQDGDETWGWFAVRQLVRDAQGEVTGIEVAFHQELKPPIATSKIGVIRHGVGPLSFALNGTLGPNAYDNKQFHGDTSLFKLDGDNERLEYTVAGRRDFWAATLEPPMGQRLKVGSYTLAEQTDGTHARVHLSGAPNGAVGGQCPSVEGTLQIKAIDTDAIGKVIGLSAVFDQQCSHDGTGRLRGTIRYRL